MRMNLVLELLDIPGQLIDALEPIGRMGANIVTVIHQRDVKTERGTIPVQITIEGDKETLDKVINTLLSQNINIMEVDDVLRKENIRTILIGNIVDKDVKDVLNRLGELESVKVVDFNLKMSDDPEKSASKIIIEADHGKRKDVMNKIKEVGTSKGFLVINEV
ncbi:MAG: amino acid-binding protein [Methanobacterium sp.]|uniref:amino acid-binding protein n=1 Tax=Methanobacterium sp. TaxID=2164 RepID=UPI003D655DAB|nr:amino acid-binding protein [Methanobacterium sp.]